MCSEVGMAEMPPVTIAGTRRGLSLSIKRMRTFTSMILQNIAESQITEDITMIGIDLPVKSETRDISA